MLNESARVVTVDEDGLWVETRRKSGCQGCGAQGSCGHSLLDRLHPGRASLLRIHLRGTDAPLAGDDVTLAVPDSLVLKLSLVFYLLPLASLLGGALLAARFGGDAAALLGALAGLGGGILAAGRIARRLEERPDYQPRILKEASAFPDSSPIPHTEF